MSFSLTIRRLAVTLVLVFVLFMVVSLIDAQVAAVLFLVGWPTLFFSWPYLSRKFGFDFPRAPQPRKGRPTEWGRLLITGVVALLIACVFTVWAGPGAMGLFALLWLTLYYAWPPFSQRVPFLNFAEPKPTASARPLWVRMLRGTGAWVAGITLTVFAFGSFSMAPLLLCYGRAHRVHDSIHIGMTVPEVLHTAKDCDIFQASSDFPHDDDADPNNIPAVSLGWSQNGTYHTYDGATNQRLALSESEALDLLHARLHDGYRWTFHYTYTNASPQHVSFRVVFGPDGRVAEVKPVYGWD